MKKPEGYDEYIQSIERDERIGFCCALAVVVGLWAMALLVLVVQS